MLLGDIMKKGLGGAGALGRCNEIGARWSECSRAVVYVRARWSVALGPEKDVTRWSVALGTSIWIK